LWSAEPGSPTLQLNGVLTNLGTLHWISANNAFNLTGNGRVENFGLWEIFQDPSFAGGSESAIQVPVSVPAGARFLVSANGRVHFTGNSTLTVAGALELQTGALLRMGDPGGSQDLTLPAGSTTSGAGTIRFDGANRLILGGEHVLGIALIDFGSSS